MNDRPTHTREERERLKQCLRFVIGTRLACIVEAVDGEENRPGETLLQKIDRIIDAAAPNLDSLADAVIELREFCSPRGGSI